MKETVKRLSAADISSDVFIVSPNQIEMIAKKFGDEMAMTMNVRPLAHKIQQIAVDVLIQTLQDARKMGE